jgi:hypothetical protein
MISAVSGSGASVLGNPPEFGAQGGWPPREGQPVELVRKAWGFQLITGKEREKKYGKSGLNTVDEKREVVYTQAWRRDDPIVQLPPGATKAHQIELTYGITESQTEELAQSLGFNIGSKSAQISGELSSKFGIQTTLSVQESVTDTITLTNDVLKGYRLFALWSIKHTITVRRVPWPHQSFQPEVLCNLSFIPPGQSTVITGWPI